MSEKNLIKFWIGAYIDQRQDDIKWGVKWEAFQELSWKVKSLLGLEHFCRCFEALREEYQSALVKENSNAKQKLQRAI